ncbi:MAG: hypothetical protein J5979_02050 [Lachnospiraceae bacterium]|nr:hypothetical protein [Lachnospiraceae bacterium]
MRYFYYGNEQINGERKNGSGRNCRTDSSYGSWQKRRAGMDDELVIEEDTIYEIDRECVACRKKYER